MTTPRRKAAGFSFLEVTAALVILSLGAVAALSWLSQSVATMNRLRAQERAQLVRLDVLDYLRALNPASRPEGAVQMADYSFSWQSRQIRDAAMALNQLSAPGHYQVSLFEVVAHVSLSADSPELDFDISLPVAGFRPVGTSGALAPRGAAEDSGKGAPK